MRNNRSGIHNWNIHETPIAVIDLETTGLTPGFDRVVEVSVVRLDPHKSSRVVLDTLVNPRRPVAATEIHGITDNDVADAPTFKEIAGDLVCAVSDCPVAAYNGVEAPRPRRGGGQPAAGANRGSSGTGGADKAHSARARYGQ